MESSKYDSIINLPRPVSEKHPPMPPESRAAQFAPFAALVGYGDVIDETARLTDRRIMLDENEKARLDYEFRRITENLSSDPVVTIGYFIPDALKEGGKEVTVTSKIMKMSIAERYLILETGDRIPLDDIYFISSDEVLPSPEI